jgi:hypothetical protein
MHVLVGGHELPWIADIERNLGYVSIDRLKLILWQTISLRIRMIFYQGFMLITT